MQGTGRTLAGADSRGSTQPDSRLRLQPIRRRRICHVKAHLASAAFHVERFVVLPSRRPSDRGR